MLKQDTIEVVKDKSAKYGISTIYESLKKQPFRSSETPAFEVIYTLYFREISTENICDYCKQLSSTIFLGCIHLYQEVFVFDVF